MSRRWQIAALLVTGLALVTSALFLSHGTQVSAANVLTNSLFTSDIVPWVAEPSPNNANATHDAVVGNAGAGSLMLQNTSLSDSVEGVAISECLALSPGLYR